MDKTQKLLGKFLAARNTFLWSDLETLLLAMGFEIIDDSGSRVKFVKEKSIINLHKPHPQKEIQSYAIKQIKDKLRQDGLI